MKSRNIIFITLNNILEPKTGGEYVYHIMREELLKNNYKVKNISLPQLLENYVNSYRSILIPIIYLYILIVSIFKRIFGSKVIITSASPIFPVFGHLVYHQPKSSINDLTYRSYLKIVEKIGLMIHEKEKMSPFWNLAKKSHVLHISNSEFTKKIVKKLYGVNSIVLYPPVNLSKYLDINIKKSRKHSILIMGPRGITGITLLPQVISKLPKNIPATIIGKSDKVGLKIIKKLKKKGFNINYLGYVSEGTKKRLLSNSSHYLHLSFNEPFGISVIESMISGCIPIAPYSGGIPEYLPPMFLYKNPEEAIQNLNNLDLCNQINKAKLRNIGKKFDEQNFRNTFIKYIETLLSR